MRRVAHHVDTASVIGISKLLVLTSQYFGIYILVFARWRELLKIWWESPLSSKEGLVL
jgi:hypothetical protein